MSAIPAQSATILLVRDVASLQVLMVKRHHQIDFASGALVFPGGKVADEDREPAWRGNVDGADQLSEIDRALRIAALREAYEESGLLLARRREDRGAGKPLAGAEACAALMPMRDAVAKGEQKLRPLVEKAGLVLALDTLTPYAHWVTPEGMGKRFDPHFFIAEAPPEQAAACDGQEAVEAVWIEPTIALADAKAGTRQIIFPTRLNLDLLAPSASADGAIVASRSRPIVTVQPRSVQENGRMMLTIPAEAGYSVTKEPLEGNRP